MQPHDPRPKKRAADRALWTYLRQHLGWLEGHPIGVREAGIAWRTWPERVGESSELLVDRERLRVAKYGLRGALRKFPRALPRLAGDVDLWTSALERRLEALAAVVHDGAELPTLERIVTLALSPRSGELRVPAWCAQDAAWLTLGLIGAPRLSVADASARLGDWRDALEVTRRFLGEERARVLAGAIVTGAFADGGARCRRFLADARVFEVATEDGEVRQALEAALQGVIGDPGERHRYLAEPASTPAAAAGSELVELLSARPDAPLARVIGALLATAPIDAWEASWCMLRAFEREARSSLGMLLTRGAPEADVVRRARDLRSDLGALEAAPPSWSVERAVELAGRLERALPDDSAEEVVGAIEAAPERALESQRHRAPTRVPAAVCAIWAEALECDLSARRAKELARLQVALVRGAEEERAGILSYAFAILVVENYEPRPSLDWVARELARDILAELWELGEPGRQVLRDADRWDVSQRFVGFVRVAFARRLNARSCAELLIEAHGVRDWLDFEFLGLLATVDGEATRDPERFWAAAEKLEPDPDEYQTLRKLALNPTTAALLGGLVADGSIGELRELAQLSSGVVKLGGDAQFTAAPPESSQPSATELAWLPPDLRPPVAELVPRIGWRGVDRVLRDDAVRPERIEAELRSLSGLNAPSPHQEARRETLRARLDSPPTPKPARLRSCRSRLERRQRLESLKAWRDALAERLLERLPDSLRGPIEDPEQLALVGALARLRPSVRALAWRVLDGEDLSAERAHVEWRERMAQRGLNLGPWLQPSVRTEAVSPNGRRLTFAVEREPFQVFQMGRWFNTCLSPGDMNFFSVVANAADENKQLLVARDERGVAQARCLLALTHEGKLLAFHVYAHEEHAWAREQFRALAEELASAVGTHLVPAGRVEVLVAPAWYDDGPRDLTGRLAELNEDGALAQRLREAPPTRARAILEEGLGPELLEAGFDHVVTRRVLTEDPDRMLSLRSLLRMRRLAPWAALDVALTLRRADPDLARDVLVDVVRRRSGRELGLWGDSAAQFARLLAELGEPSLALRVLRTDECTGPAATMARAVADAALGRTARARNLLEPLAGSGDREARRLLASLLGE